MSIDVAGAGCTTGAILLGRYRLLRTLASGGMSEVYLAEQLSVGRMAAVKIVRPFGSTISSELRSRLRREARTASRLVHPNIVTIYDSGELADGSVFLAMEYIEGVPLRLLISQRPLTPARAIHLACQCASALHFAHTRGVIHRDFKPENVMVTHSSQRDLIKVVDFGVARRTENPSDTQPGMLIGTPRYMSPEQCRGEAATPKSDQYAFGLVLYEMLTGVPAIDAPNALTCLRRHQDVVPPAPSAVIASTALRALDPLVMRMLAKDPEQRYPDLGHVLQLLGAIAGVPTEDILPPPTADVQHDEFPTLAGATPLADKLTRVSLVGKPGLLRTDGHDVLQAHGLLLGEHDDAELNVISMAPAEWKPRKPAREPTLACVDASLDTALPAALLSTYQGVMLGPHPLDPYVLALALSWMGNSSGAGIECFTHGGIQVLQVTCSSRKSSYVDSLIEDARSEGVRRSVLLSLAEVAEELILNAVRHAPVELDGSPRYSRLPRSADITLRAGEEVTLRWLIGRRFVAVSVRDVFGSLSPEMVLSKISSTSGPDLEGRVGVGMGLRIVSRAAQHVIFGISKGSWCEVVALVPREPADKVSARRSVCILRAAGGAWERAGDRLRICRISRDDGVDVTFRGEINETSVLDTVFQHRGTIRLDLSGVTRINSVGIRIWLEAMRAATSQRLIMTRCSPCIVNQINLIPSLAQGVEVESILVPYVCRTCSEESLELVKTSIIRGGNPPVRHCVRCREALDCDAVVEEYFAVWRS
jgi:serine/threonine protein kinase